MRHLKYRLNSKSFILGVAALWFFSLNCEQKTEYQKLVEHELNSGVRYDTLFLGYYFGMTKEEFFEHSWELNRKKLVVNGTGAEIQQEVPGLKARAGKVFYPEFLDNKIYRMPVRYFYYGWAPWNKSLWADSLILEVKDLIADKYNIEFRSKFDSVSQKTIYYQVTGNLQINIKEKDQSQVLVEYIDLSQLYPEL